MKPEQERVRHLLKDTVTLLCKNGLQYHEELKVEGLLGITLDNNDVFLVHINEKFAGGVRTSAKSDSQDFDLPALASSSQGRAKNHSQNAQKSVSSVCMNALQCPMMQFPRLVLLS